MRRFKIHTHIFALLIGMLILVNCKTTQTAIVESLGKYYGQGHYQIVLRKAESNIENEEIEDKAIFYLYKAVSLAKLSKDKRHSKSSALKESIIAYEKYFKLTKGKNNNQTITGLLSDLKIIYKSSNSVAISSEAYSFLMNNKSPILVYTPKKKTPKTTNPKKIVFRGDKKDTLVKDKILSKEEQMIAYAKKFLGVPYQYGGTGNSGFDCSGYTQYIYSRYEMKIPRSARTQRDKLAKIPLKDAEKGDLIFFSKNKKSISHVGIVVSEKGKDLTMIHASSSRGIMITNVSTNSYWKPKLMSAGRIK